MDTIAYTTQPLEFETDVKRVNPVHYNGPVDGVKTVYLAEGYDRIAWDYKEAGAEVHPLNRLKRASEVSSSADAKTTGDSKSTVQPATKEK